MLNIVLFGPPGAGKGTQSEKLIAKYNLIHLSTGDIFRANIKGETELGKLAKSYMDQGQLVPDSVTISMLEAEVNKNNNAKGFIFDGFPRTQAQAVALDNLLKSKKTSITLMLALEVQEEELRKRLLLRGQNSGRPDDQNPEVIQKRIDVYNNETAPVKDFYTSQGKYQGVYGIGEIESIFKALCAVIDSKIKPTTKNASVKKVISTTRTAAKKIAKKKKVMKKKAAKKVVKKSTKKKAVKKIAKNKTTKPTKKKVVKKNSKKATKKVTKSVRPTGRKVAKKATKKKVVKVAKKKVIKKVTKPNRTTSKKTAPKKLAKKQAKKIVAKKKVVKKKKK
ncbi:MAG: adenylate kinase [Bacteroidia bacterium]|nr:adenylate kinase [Bacteroidia bacterium]